jgi:hypothetical protein
MTFKEILLRIIDGAAAWNTSRQAAAGSDPSSDAVLDADDPLPPPSHEEGALRRFLSSLTARQVYMATALMYAGRGDFGEVFVIIDEYKKVRDTFGSLEGAIRQMAEKFPLPEYLAAGMRRVEALGTDVDDLR